MVALFLLAGCSTPENAQEESGEASETATGSGDIEYCGEYAAAYRQALYDMAEQGRCVDGPSVGAEIQAPEVRAELLEMFQQDQKLREELKRSAELSDDRKAEIREASARHAKKLEGYLDQLDSWPGLAQVGLEGANAAWIIAQHTDHNRDRQRRFLRAIHRAVEEGNAPPNHFAYLVDRYRTSCGQHQIFGTQADFDDGELAVGELEDRESLDPLRERFCLKPMSEYKRDLREMYQR